MFSGDKINFTEVSTHVHLLVYIKFTEMSTFTCVCTCIYISGRSAIVNSRCSV